MIMVYSIGLLIGFIFSGRTNLKHSRENVRHCKAHKAHTEIDPSQSRGRPLEPEVWSPWGWEF